MLNQSPFNFSFYHTAAALQYDSTDISTPAVQNACYAESSCTDTEWMTKLFEIAERWWQRCSANGPHSANEEWKIATFADHKTIDCTINVNEMTAIIAVVGSGSNIILTYSTRSCTSGPSTVKMTFIVSFGSSGCVASLINSVYMTVCSAHPTSMKDYFAMYKEETCCVTLFGWCNMRLSLDCIKQSSTFCSRDHYTLYQKLTFYNSAIGKEWHVRHIYTKCTLLKREFHNPL